MYEGIKCLVIIPTYNEIENIGDIISAVLSQGSHFHILIVDDNSPDGTASLVLERKADLPDRIHLLQRSGKLGLGTAYIAGFQFGLNHQYDYLFEMDADFSHDPKDLNRLLDGCLQKNADFAIGSRYVKGGGISNWPKDRLFLSYGASIYVRIVTGMPIKDPTAGFICYHNKVLRGLDLSKIKFSGYAFQIEMKYAAYLKGYKWIEVPIIFSDRIKGTSKMSTNIVSEAIKGVLGLRLKAFKGYYQ
ncbi:MAG TPA: polyprenol monophosphomannose synthase [Saprospiraceae bacterium]|nr:polyprenol monophosphomannose synthase [Saprospiraceae bacterium]